MQGLAAEALSPAAQRKLSMVAAGVIAAIAILLAVLIALHTPKYEAEARLSYSASGQPAGTANIPSVSSSASALPTGAGAATRVATSALSDAQLASFIATYNLYPDLRQKKTSRDLVEMLRRDLLLTEPETGILQVAFRNPEQEKTQELTNGVAALLANYEVLTSVPGPPVAPLTGRAARRAARSAAQHRAVAVVAAPVPRVFSSGSNAQVIAKLTHEISRVDLALQDMTASKAELEVQRRQVDEKIAALEKSERRATTAEGRVGAQDGLHEQIVLGQQIAAQKARLAELRARYTDEYPDVQQAESDLTNLQGRLARLTENSGSPGTASSKGPSPEMQTLRQEQERVERDLARNESQTTVEQERKAGLLLEMAQAQEQAKRSPQSSAVPLPVPQAPTPTAVPVPQDQRPVIQDQGPAITVRVLPFHVVERAGPAGLVGTSRLALGLWLALGTLILFALCFVPLVPAHYHAVVTTEEDLRQIVPEHVTYLGGVGLGDTSLADVRRSES